MYERIKEVYNIRYEDIPTNNVMVKSKQIRSDLLKKLDRNFKMHTKGSLTKLKKHGVTHILTFKDHYINGLEIIAEYNL